MSPRIPLVSPRLPRILLLLAGSILLPLVAAGPASARVSGDPAHVDPTRILIGLAADADFGDLAPLHAELGARLVRELPGTRIAIVDAPRPADALARYAEHPASRWAERDQIVWISGLGPDAEAAGPSMRARLVAAAAIALPGLNSAARDRDRDTFGRAEAPAGPHRAQATHPDDPLYPDQWHHEKIGSAIAWDFGRAHEVTIAIIDTGVECDHPDLVGSCVAGYDYVNDDPDPDDDNQHGTIEAGVAAALTDNALGVAGLAWGAKIMPLKAMSGNGSGGIAAIASSIEHAAEHGAQVINMSLGSESGSQAMADAVAFAAQRGVFMAAAGGNGGTGLRFPAAYPEVVGVAGTREDDSHPPFTTGDHLEVAAPGWDIQTLTLTSEGSYARHHGTSEATPLVAALAALLIEQHPEWSVDQVRRRIIETSVDLGDPGWDQEFGWGRIDAGRALDPDFTPEPTPLPSATPTASASPTASPSPSPSPSPATLHLPWLQRP